MTHITITIEITGDNLDITTSNTEPEPIPQGSEALVEHADHDSTPRLLGFTAQPAHYDN